MHIFQFPWKTFNAIRSLPLIRKLVWVPLPLLWFGTSIMNIHKIVKSTNDNLMQGKRQNYNVLKRHVTDWPLFRTDIYEPKLSNLPTATYRICHKLENRVNLEFLGVTINSVTLELCFNKTKIQKVVSECQNFLNNPQTSIL